MRRAYRIRVESRKTQRCKKDDMRSRMTTLNSRSGAGHDLSLCLQSWLCSTIYQACHICINKSINDMIINNNIYIGYHMRGEVISVLLLEGRYYKISKNCLNTNELTKTNAKYL